MSVSSLVTLADVLAHLNMTSLPPDGGVELQGFIDDAQPVIEDIVGHVAAAEFDETYNGGDTCIYLRETPVLSIASMTEVIGFTKYTLTQQLVGAAVDNYGYTLDLPAEGRVTRRSAGSTPYPFYANIGNIEVVYTAGRPTVPGNVRMGTLELIRHWYQQGQQAYGRQNSYVPQSTEDSADDYSQTPSGYLIPNRVKEALMPSRRPWVIA